MPERQVPEAQRAVDLLALLLSAVSNDESSACPPEGNHCAVCSAADAAQSFLNDLHPDRSTGWWWEESNEAVVAAVEALDNGEWTPDA